MKVISQNTLVLKTLRHDFNNDFAYIEQWVNHGLKDCFFAEKESLFPDGTLKPKCRKYFYCPYMEEPEKTVKQVNTSTFNAFENLFYFDEEGDVFCITNEGNL